MEINAELTKDIQRLNKEILSKGTKGYVFIYKYAYFFIPVDKFDNKSGKNNVNNPFKINIAKSEFKSI